MVSVRPGGIRYAFGIMAALILVAIHGAVHAQEVMEKMGVEVLIERNQDITVTESIYIRAKPRVRNFVRTLPKKFYIKSGLCFR